MIKIIFVGDKPSKKNFDPDVAFVGTRSYVTLIDWINLMGLRNPVYTINSDTPAKQQSIAYARLTREFKFVALGNNASKVLSKLKIPHFKLPHPSGLNRKCNDKEYLSRQLEKCRQYLEDANAQAINKGA